MIDHHAHTGSEGDMKFSISIEELLKNIHTKFEARSYHSFNDILDQSHHYIIIAQSGPISHISNAYTCIALNCYLIVLCR